MVKIKVKGVEKRLDEVTDSDQEKMTEEERETYANLVGGDDDY